MRCQTKCTRSFCCQFAKKYVGGVNAGTIANTLSSEHLLIPSAYKYEHGIVSKPRACKDPYFWSATTIHKLLDVQAYIGDMVNFTTYSNSYKNRKSRENDKDKRLIFKDTHPAIISKETWEMVQKVGIIYNNIGVFDLSALEQG